jgi:ElaB/YqjD/DUF883 family membrane-anchored ribosome-binding protein
MTDKDIRSEIEELKAKLESLSSTGGQGAGQSAAGAAPYEAGASDDTGAGGWLRDIMKQAEELMGGLDLQLKDVPAKTALMIFALGVVTGRLLSKRD